MPCLDPDEQYVRPRPVTCPACNGKKYVKHEHTDACARDNDTILCRMEVNPCTTCDGKGVVAK